MYTFIVNPNARSGLGHIVWKELEKILLEKQIVYKVYFTKYQKHATDIVSQITSDNREHIIVVLGGDGTVNEVINGIRDFQNTVLGYIPIGSSNDFARGMHIPADPSEALNTILTMPYIRPVNVGELKYGTKSRRFAVSSGIGFDAAICHEAVISKLKFLLNKMRLGKLTYAGIALHRLFLTTPQRLTMVLDFDKEITFQSAYFAAIMNHKYEGGGLKFCPDAVPDDGKLDIIVVDSLPKLKILFFLPTAFKGWHTHFKGIHIYRGSHVSFRTPRALPVHTDGEPVFLQHEISVSCHPEMLRVITTARR